MAYDEDLADRVRELLVEESDVNEQKMFGGLAFLIGGRMAVAASGQGGLLVRVDPAKSDKLLATTTARPMEGWLRVDADATRTKRQLARWVGLGITHARSLPPKSATSSGLRGGRAPQSWRPPPTGSMPSRRHR